MELVYAQRFAKKSVPLICRRGHIYAQERPLDAIEVVGARQNVVHLNPHRKVRDAVFGSAFLVEVVFASAECRTPLALRVVGCRELAPADPDSAEPSRRQPVVCGGSQATVVPLRVRLIVVVNLVSVVVRSLCRS